MDIDTTEFRRYLDNGADFTLQPPPPNRASRASNAGLCVIESSITAGIEANEGDPRREEDIDASAVAGGAGTNSGVMQPPSAIDDHVMAGAANLDEIVNSNELRRRSQANVFGVDSLYLEDGPSFMVPSGGAYSSAPMSAAMMSVLPPTTMEDLMDMGATTADLGMFTFSGGMPSAGDIQSAVSMFADQSGIAPSPHPSPVITHLARGSSVHSSPVGPSLMGSSGNMRPRTLLARNPTMSSISSLPEAGLPGEEIENSSPMPMDTRLDQNTSVPMSGVTNEGQINEPIVSKTTSLFPQNIYSSSGFDMLDILRRVATRPNPEINIGAVDMSCAFVVTDQRKYDNPIVYCSATFERLTGYTKHEVLGRNCRFLQAPDGQIKSGDKRKYVDENAVFYLKAQIKNKNEAQTSLINYRKGGQSFTNLLTMIPITYNSDDVVYYVGFQVDLVDQPGAMMNRNQGKDGSYAVNYQYSQLPTYMPAASMLMDQGPRLTVGRDDVSQVLASFGAGDSELHSKRIMDKVLLENTDDVVHVLSLKGLFLYCSPSIRKVLEYEPHELVGTSLSGVCHPSDIVPVTRDLKDTSAGSTVNVVFRIRRKHSGYTWFESHGCLHTEQGKGRKCIILVGRERPVYVLQTRDVQANGGIGENELWTKMSTSGMFLYVSSNVKALLDRDGEELTGTSVQALMRSDAKNEVGKALEVARQGKKTTVRHELQNKRGQFLQALTTLFPGDGNDLSTPTFLVAQTRLLKHSRQSSSTNTKVTNSTPETATSSHASTPSVWSAATQSTQPTTSGERSKSAESKESDQAVGDDNMFEELKTTRSTSWQFELRQMQRTNKRLTEELNALLTSRKKRKRRKGADQLEKDCANCHTRTTPEWRRGPSGKRDLCNSCGLRYAKLVNRGSSRNGGTNSEKSGCSPLQTTSPMTMQSLAVELSPMNPTPTPTLTQPQLHPISESTPPHQPNGMLKADVGGSEPASPVAGKPPFQQISGARRGSMGNLPITPKQRHQVIHSRRGSMPSSSTASTLTPGHSSTASMPTSHLNNSTTYNDGGGDGGG